MRCFLGILCVVVSIVLGAPASAIITVGAFDPPGEVRKAVISNGYAYLASDSTLYAVDISDPHNPSEVGRFEAGGDIGDVVVTGDIAYITASLAGLRILDVSDPANISELGFVDEFGPARSLEVDGDIVYFIAGRFFYVVDVSNPVAPAIIGSRSASQATGDFVISNGIAYIPFSSSQPLLMMLDISDPTAPDLAGFYFVTPEFQYIQAIEVRGSTLYIGLSQALFTGIRSMRIVDISTPTAPVELGAFLTSFSILDIHVSGNSAFLAAGFSGLVLLDVLNPTYPMELARFDTPDHAESVTVDGSFAYVADRYSGMRAIDITHLEVPAAIGSLTSPGDPRAIDVSDSVAYLGDRPNGLQTIDVNDPRDPALIETLGVDGDISAVEIVDGLAYVAAGSGGFQIIDVSNPESPTTVVSVDTDTIVQDVAVVGGLAYLAAEDLLVYDVSNPSAPVWVSTFEAFGFADKVAVSQGIAVAIWRASSASGFLRIIDVSDPAAPVELATYTALYVPQNLCIDREIAYVADSTRGLKMIDISDPTAPRELGVHAVHQTGGQAVADVRVKNGIAFIAGGFDGVRVVDVSDPTATLELGGILSTSPTGPSGNEVTQIVRSVVPEGDYLYAIEKDNGLRVFDFGPEYRSKIDVDIDIKPGSTPNSINPLNEGVIPVAVLGSEKFEVTDIDVATLRFWGAEPAHDLSDWDEFSEHLTDTNGDGITDLVSHYVTVETEIDFGDVVACLAGKTVDSTPFMGCDAVRTVPDMDGDELLDVDEVAIGTDALNPDTDGDGFNDGEEVLEMGTNPLDPLDPATSQVGGGAKRRNKGGR